MTFEFWVNYFKYISLMFIGFGLFWCYTGTFDPLGIWDSYFAKAFWGIDQLPPDAAKTKKFILAPFGATSAGYFTFQYFVIKYAFAKKEMWGYKAVISAFLIWFINDSIMTIHHGAYFNLFSANLFSLLMMSPIFFLKKYFKSAE